MTRAAALIERMCFPAICTALLGLLATFPVLAKFAGQPAAPTYSLREWHVQDGLPHEEVYGLAQDRTGYLWIGTTGGLVRFDGAYFQPATPAGISFSKSSRVLRMVDVPDLGLLMASERGGLWIGDGATIREASLPGLPPNVAVVSMFKEPGGAVWLVCSDGPIVRHHAGKVESFAAPAGFDPKRTAFFASDSRGRTWIASRTFLGYCEDRRLEPAGLDLAGSEFRVASSRTGGPWIVTRDRVHRLEGDSLNAGLPIPPLVGAHYVRALLEDREGTLWIGTRSQGLWVIAPDRCVQIATPQEDVTALVEDSEGTLWVGMNGGGLARIRPKSLRLYNKEAGLLDNYTFTICEDRDGVMWLGNRDGGVARIREGAVETIAPRPDWPAFSAMSLSSDGAGHIWVSGALTLFRIQLGRDERMERLQFIPPMPSARVTFVDRRGDLWISHDPDRIGRVRAGRLETFGRDDGLDGSELRCVSEDGAGRIWFGTAGGGLFRFVDGRFVIEPFDRPPHLGAIQAILVEDGGPLWLATDGNGLGAIVGGRYRELTTAHGLLDDSLSQIMPDGLGYFWFASSRGVFRVSRRELDDWLEGRIQGVHAIDLGVEEGLKGMACLGMFQPAACRSRDGRLWFATRRGVLTFDPATAIRETPPPPVFINEIIHDDRPLTLDPDRPLRLSADMRKIAFRFAVLCFSAPERVQVRYRLHGFDDDWMTDGAGRMATYPALPPRDYRLHVIASNGDGVWNEQGATLAFTVVPLWWQTWWFRGGALLSLVGAVSLVVRKWSHRRLTQRLERLERESAIARERSRIARNIHDDLGASLTQISLLTQCARRDAAPANVSYIDRIHETVTEITRSMDEIVWAVNPRHDNLESLVGYLGNYAQNLLTMAGIRCRLDLPDVVPAVDLTSQRRHTLYLCFKEALNNILKHAGADEVSIAMQMAANEVCVTITDNGHGLSPSPVVVDPNRACGGQGLENIRRRMAGIGGSGEIAAAPSQGTRVTLAFPLPQTPR